MREIGKFVVLKMLRGYKWAISPMFPPACRYVPTCSEYAMEAVERYGVLRGAGLALWRLLRCHPLAHGGHDPVVKNGADCQREASGVLPSALGSHEQFPQGLEPTYFCDSSGTAESRALPQARLETISNPATFEWRHDLRTL